MTALRSDGTKLLVASIGQFEKCLYLQINNDCDKCNVIVLTSLVACCKVVTHIKVKVIITDQPQAGRLYVFSMNNERTFNSTFVCQRKIHS